MERTDFAPGEELKIYRRQRVGKPIAEKYKQHFAALTPLERKLLEDLAVMNDQADREMRRARRNGIGVIDNGQVLPPRRSSRPLARRRGAGRPAHRRTASSRAGPDDSDPDGPGEAGLNLTALWRILERLILNRVRLVLARFGRVVA